MGRSGRWLLSVGIAVLLLSGLGAVIAHGQGPEQPWLVRLSHCDEATLGHLVRSGVRVLYWRGTQAVALAGARERAVLAAAGLEPEVLSRQPPQGDYYLFEAPAERAALLAERYGPLVAVGPGQYLAALPPEALVGLPFAWRLPERLVAPQPAPPAPAAPQASPRQLPSLVDSVSATRLAEHVAQLQDDDDHPGADALRSRYSMVPGLDAEAAYIAAQLRSAGLEVSYFPFTAVDYGLQVSRIVSNVIGTLPGARPEGEGFYIVCAHYDSTASGNRDRWPAEWRTLPAPGADDNASGVAGVLEAARVLASQPLAYGVRFVFFAGEEQGLQGSRAYAGALRAEGARLLGVINLDMVAYDSDGDGRFQLHAGSAAASQALGAALARNAGRYAPALRPQVLTDTATNRSDHAPFWVEGYPAVLVIEDFGRDSTPYYHTMSDTLSTLHLAYCTDLVRATVATAAELAQVLGPDLSASSKVARLESPLPATVAYTVTLANSGQATAHAVLSDALAPGLVPYGAPRASSGQAGWDLPGRTLHWQGEIAPQDRVTIAFRALIDPGQAAGLRIPNVARVDDGTGRLYELSADVRSPWRWALPVLTWEG